MEKLEPEFKAKWIAALRSGEYKQCIGSLHRDGGHCCLGVAEIVLGLKSQDTAILNGPGFPQILCGPAYSNTVVDELTGRNDRIGASFSEIADYIEANL